jgi:hypothetical protein
MVCLLQSAIISLICFSMRHLNLRQYTDSVGSNNKCMLALISSNVCDFDIIISGIVVFLCLLRLSEPLLAIFSITIIATVI